MKKFSFSANQKEKMAIWRKDDISTKEQGTQSKDRKTGKPIYHAHIVPKKYWIETLWKDIRLSLPKYLEINGITAHTGTHNLVSSWITCANLYFPIDKSSSLRHLMLKFLKKKVSPKILEITDVQLEFAFPKGDKLHPSLLLGEVDGSRGSGQTSPDVAFKVKTADGEGIVLTECKYTEHSFYGCSARKIDKEAGRVNNPDPKRCMQKVSDCDYSSVCHQAVWGRKYISLIKYSEFGKGSLTRCPAATAGYQLLRQQALAEGIAQYGKYPFVASTVAFDNRNTDLIGCLRATGIDDFQTGWGKLFDGRAIFKTWTHQDWVQFVRDNQNEDEFNDWLGYLDERKYGY